MSSVTQTSKQVNQNHKKNHIAEKNKPSTNDEKKKITSNESIDDVPSVKQASKQVNQNHKQNHVENKKNTLHTQPKKEVKQNNNTNDQSSTIPEKNKPLSNDNKKKN